jgi:hypothetical protein
MKYHCSIGLVKVKFMWSKPKTWLAPLIRFFTKFEYNHSVVFIVRDGITWVYEAKAEGVVKSRFLDWKFDVTTEKALLLEPLFNFNLDVFEETCEKSLGTKYDFESTLFHQLIRQLTNERVWIGQKTIEHASREVNCSEFAAFLYWRASQHRMFDNWYMADPSDLFDLNKFRVTKIK